MAESIGLQRVFAKTEAMEKVPKVEREHPQMDQHKFSMWLRQKDLKKQRKARSPTKPGEEKESERKESSDPKGGSEEQKGDALYSRDGRKEWEEERITGERGQFFDVLA